MATSPPVHRCLGYKLGKCEVEARIRPAATYSTIASRSLSCGGVAAVMQNSIFVFLHSPLGHSTKINLRKDRPGADWLTKVLKRGDNRYPNASVGAWPSMVSSLDAFYSFMHFRKRRNAAPFLNASAVLTIPVTSSLSGSNTFVCMPAVLWISQVTCKCLIDGPQRLSIMEASALTIDGYASVCATLVLLLNVLEAGPE